MDIFSFDNQVNVAEVHMTVGVEDRKSEWNNVETLVFDPTWIGMNEQKRGAWSLIHENKPRNM